ncbi:MAG: cytochrome P450, partial [Nitrososphaerota archaeon]
MATPVRSTPPAEPYLMREKRHLSQLPGPPWHTVARNTISLLRRALDFSMEMRERYGDVVSVPTLIGRVTLIFHPDGVRHVLQENHRNYNKDIPDYRVLSLLLGKGLLTNDGESWLQQRRLMQPAFHRDRIAALGTIMSDTTLAWLEQLEARGLVATGTPLDMLQEMSRLTLSIVCKALFGADLPANDLERVGRALTTANRLLSEAFYLPGILTLPTPQRHRLFAARRELYVVVDEIIRRRRASSEQRGDLLAMLLEARDAETGEGMSDEQVRDEVLTLLLAGHETTANALSWTFYLLAQHPDVTAAVREEYQRVLQGRPPAVDDLPRLAYSRMVIEESMRLYPPAWALGRHGLQEDEIGGYVIPKGAYVLVMQYVTHRHPAFWEQPDAFDPERFSAERAAKRPRFAYFPFGGGPRLCIGNQFALTEAQLILASILSRYQVRLEPGAHVAPEPLVTLRPRGTLLMRVHRNDASS